MHCKVALSDEFVILNTKSSWRLKTYKVYRENLLFDIERARLPGTQRYAENYKNAVGIVEPAVLERNKLSEQKEQITVQIRAEYAKLNNADSKLIRTLIRGRNKLIRQCKPYNRTLLLYKPVVKTYGLRGLVDADGLEGQKKAERVVVKACPAAGCVAFLDKDFKCTMCMVSVCKKCHEIRESDVHECNPDNVETIKAIKAEAKGCPKCGTLISKIDGCDQMWCTQCHVTFSWRTGLVEAGNTHNPHYYEYMRKNGGLMRAPGDVVCGGFPHLNLLVGRFDGLDYSHIGYMDRTRDYSVITENQKKIYRVMEYHRQIGHFDRFYGSGLPVTATDNHDLRVQFLCKMVDEAKMKTTLQRRDKAYRKNLTKNQIYVMVYTVSGDLYRAFMFDSDVDKVLLTVHNLLLYANECLKQVETQYSCITKQYQVFTDDEFRFT